MKGLAEINAENNAIVARARKREADSLYRLKRRVRSALWRRKLGKRTADIIDDIMLVIDGWAAAEKRRVSP